MLVQSKLMGAEKYGELVETGGTLQDPLLFPILLLALYVFFGFFWTRTGQTLGMQAWHIKIQKNDQSMLTWQQAFIRFISATISLSFCFIGYLWVLLDGQKRSWQCIASDSEVIRIPKRK